MTAVYGKTFQFKLCSVYLYRKILYTNKKCFHLSESSIFNKSQMPSILTRPFDENKLLLFDSELTLRTNQKQM